MVGDSNSVAGVIGTSSGSDGIQGITTNNGSKGIDGFDNSAGGGVGVKGTSNAGTGVYGLSSAVTGAGVFGMSSAENGTGVWGQTSGPSIQDSLAGAVVDDDTPTGPGGVGVFGDSVQGTGVKGATLAIGQSGVVGVDFSGGHGIGVTAQSATGTALNVEGKATFTRSGVTSLTTAGTSVLTGVVPGGLTTTSHVLAMLQANQDCWRSCAAVPNTTTGKITIYFTGSVPVGTKVAWFVFG